jgi:DNA polymerase III subunit epsilon
MTIFAAIDFETANYNRDSACAVGIVIVSEGKIVQRIHTLIKPPNSFFQFTHIHGLTWEDVEDEAEFREVWPNINKHIKDVEFLAAHNASFDRGVLNACCSTYGLSNITKPFICTVQVARSKWNIHPTKLPNVCDHLNIELNHHEALSDAEACARIILAAEAEGWMP